jgi:cysteine desulfurase/selenocysteine lyase
MSPNATIELPVPSSTLDLEKIRADFPILGERAYGKPLIYLDNAASSQKPKAVIDALVRYYTTTNANVHRGVHFLSQKASQEFDEVRLRLRDYINAASEREIIFVRGATEGINLVASSWGRTNLQAGDVVLVSGMEHHSNIVPWQLVCNERGAVLKHIPILDNGELDLEAYHHMLDPKVRFVSVVHTSNSLGTVNPVKQMVDAAHARGIPVLVDGAQTLAHGMVDVQELGCDFLVFSGHKMLGPTGIGVLYGKEALLEAMPPYQGGGEMIHSVSFEKTTYNDLPYKFEAGTPNIADVIGLGAALDYWAALDRRAASDWEQQLLRYASSRVVAIPGVRIIGTAKEKAGVLSFVVDRLNALDIGMFLDTQGVAVRTGHHCTEPVMDRFDLPGTVRASFMFYNTAEEVDVFIDALRRAIHLLKKD